MGDPRHWLLVGVLPLGCVFATAEANSTAEVAESETETDGEGTAGDADGEMSGASTASSQSGGQGSATSGPGSDASSGSSAPSTDDPTDAVQPRADLTFVEPGPVDLGQHPLAGQDVMTLQLVNEGDAAANILGGEDPPAPLIWAGGAFPGTDGDCQGLIPPGGECVVTLAVGAGVPGLATGTVEVRFDDMVGAGTAFAAVELVATGQGPNMILNADAESDPAGPILTGWDVEGSTFHTTGEHNHGAGSLAFFAGGSSSPHMTQELVLTTWAESIDTLEMSFRFRGWTRARDDFWEDDPHDIGLLFLDGTGEVLDSRSRSNMTHDGWEETAFDAILPVGTRRVRIRLSCDRNSNLPGNDNCSAWFDDLFGGLVYEG